MSAANNWAKNLTYSSKQILEPGSVEELQEMVAKSQKCKALGSRHSFSTVADTDGDHASTARLNGILEIGSRTVTVQPGIRYGDLCPKLQEKGLAVHNLASLPHISVAGAVATATHGSGFDSGNLSTAVSELKIVRADGEIVSLDRNAKEFAGAVVNVGALGVVAELTLDLEPAFEVTQHVYEGLPIAAFLDHFEEIEALGYSVSVFTEWSGDLLDMLWVKRRVKSVYAELPADLYGAKPSTVNRHPIMALDPINCTPQLGVPGPSYERLPHFRLDFTPSSGEELQSEYLIPKQFAVQALARINEMRDQISPLLQTSEIRAIAADDLWLSPCYKQACIGIHFTWKPDWSSVRALLPTIEDRLAPFDARPHWGKLSTTPAERISELYEKLPDFRRLAATLDPNGKFRNEYLSETLW
jgi:xylitol oxidase